MSTFYYCKKCRRYWTSRAAHDGCDAAPETMSKYNSPEDEPTNGDYITVVAKQLTFLSLVGVCWLINPWFVLIPVIMEALTVLTFGSFVRVINKILP